MTPPSPTPPTATPPIPDASQPASTGAPAPLPSPDATDPSYDPLVAAILETFPAAPEPPPADPNATPAPAAPPAPDPAAPAAPPEPAPEPPKPKLKAVKPKPAPPAAPPPAPTVTPPAPPAPPAPPMDAEAAYIAGLQPLQKLELERAEVAEALMPDKYKDRKKKIVEFYKKADAKAIALKKEDPHRTLNADDDEWQEFLATKPKLDADDLEVINDERTIRKAEERALKRINAEAEPLVRKVKALEVMPQIQQTLENFSAKLKESLPEDMRECINPENTDDPEAELAVPIAKDGVALSATYLRMVNGLETFDANNPMHQYLQQFIHGEMGQFHQQATAEMKTREGKTWVTWQQWSDLNKQNPQEAAQKYWTFGVNDILFLIKDQTQFQIQKTLENERVRAKRIIEKSNKPATPPASTTPAAVVPAQTPTPQPNPAPPAVRPATPVARPSPAPGSAAPPAPAPSNDFLGALEIPGLT